MNMRSIYRKIAKKHGVTVEEVKREMQAAIDYAYQPPDLPDRQKSLQNSVPSKGAIPETEELIRYIAGKIKEKQR